MALQFDEHHGWDDISWNVYDASVALVARVALARSFEGDLTHDQSDAFAQLDEQVSNRLESVAMFLAAQSLHE